MSRVFVTGMSGTGKSSALAELGRLGKETVIGADDDPDPSQPTSPEITYAPPACAICAKPVSGKRVYCSDACRKRAARASS